MQKSQENAQKGAAVRRVATVLVVKVEAVAPGWREKEAATPRTAKTRIQTAAETLEVWELLVLGRKRLNARVRHMKW